jgi:hypothetical protein
MCVHNLIFSRVMPVQENLVTNKLKLTLKSLQAIYLSIHMQSNLF